MLGASPLVCPLDSRLEEVVGLGGLEPPTSRLSGARSSQLSYRPRELPRRFFLQRPSFSKSWCRVAAHSVLQNQTASPKKSSRIGLGNVDLVDLTRLEKSLASPADTEVSA